MANITQIRLSGTTYDIVDESAVHSLSGYSTTQEMNQAITAATAALAEAISEQGYQTSGDVQTAINEATSGLAQSSAVTALNDTVTGHTADTTIHVTVADKTSWNAKLDAADVTGFFGAVNYDSQSKRINFYNTSTGGTVLAYVDATDFIKDGMVDTVEIDTPSGGTYSGQTCLIITFNTDAGKEEIDIPISGIFDADNYYTVDEIDQMTSDIYNEIDTKEEVIATALNDLDSSKQDELVSGVNIKTINNESILGSGNITLQAQITIDDALSTSSENPVQNKVVTNAINGKNQVITISGEELIIS